MLFDELKPLNKAAEGKCEERRLRAEMRRDVGADYYGFNRDEDDGTKERESFRNVERAREEGAPEGWTSISFTIVASFGAYHLFVVVVVRVRVGVCVSIAFEGYEALDVVERLG